MRLPAHFTRYGYFVACCGMLELLHLVTLRPIDVVALLLPVIYLAVLSVVSRVVWTRQESDETHFTSIAKEQRDHFLQEIAIYVVVALLALIIARELFGLPLLDALYDTVFILIFGYFAAVENTLLALRNWQQQGIQQRIETFRLVPVSHTLTRVTYSLLLAVVLFLGVATVRLYAALGDSPQSYPELMTRFAIETGFFLAMLGYLLLRLVRSYTTNLHRTLESQLKVVRDAQAGDYSQNVPILSQNELGLLGMQINRLIEYVRKRADVENLLKRVVSPGIMEKLLTTDNETLKQGEEHEVAILFCDIRGFTEMSEGASATDIIFFLNSFFSDLTEIVARNNGIINKFMGDAILAVFGADKQTDVIDAAMNTANEITMRVRQMRLPNGASPETGTGIHFGRVVAGTIGSDQRYEYTFLGDAVNTASRLQGLSKRFGYPIIVSSEAYGMLSEHLKEGLADLGQHSVRGKAEALHIYGGPIERRD